MRCVSKSLTCSARNPQALGVNVSLLVAALRLTGGNVTRIPLGRPMAGLSGNQREEILAEIV